MSLDYVASQRRVQKEYIRLAMKPALEGSQVLFICRNQPIRNHTLALINEVIEEDRISGVTNIVQAYTKFDKTGGKIAYMLASDEPHRFYGGRYSHIVFFNIDVDMPSAANFYERVFPVLCQHNGEYSSMSIEY